MFRYLLRMWYGCFGQDDLYAVRDSDEHVMVLEIVVILDVFC